ncbi:MAG: RagB/SusD family nutrient uptake outer membrane protein, partial [Bacteroidaceae bacterium]|nr:RagB/SusD family nutrient uptake outer membrane protein [Bacteroidaceae bacterium]
MTWYIGTITESGGDMKVWNYTTIRKVNEAIKQLKASTKLDESTQKQMLGECHFLRAYLYYEMVRCHGGVPYIKEPQDKDGDLMVARNTTPECFQYMEEDLTTAINNLPARHAPGSASYGRIDGVFARAFLAKVLLLKCSPQFNPSKQWTNQYWDAAYKAAKNAYDFAIENGLKLQQTNNYNNIWLDETGEECIFPVIYSYPNKYSSVEGSRRPASVSRGTPSSNPTWDMVKSFPMLDGKAWNDPTGKYYVGDEDAFMQAFWKNRDPRFEAVVLHNGELYPLAGTAAGNRYYNVLGLVTRDDAYGTNPNAGATSSNNDVYSGFINNKFSDMSLTQAAIYNYDIDFQLMRLPEVMFMLAETANETGKTDVALDMLKQVRKRAGIEAGEDGTYGLGNLSREDMRAAILAERNVELCFEGHRFWDLRRTRNMMQLSGHMKYGLEAIAINEDGTEMTMDEARTKINTFQLTPENFKYVKHRVPKTEAAEHELIIEESFYFFPIQTSKLNENSNLEQNNNWGGTFNPTME